jgi:type IV pilus assembly protein PilA
MIWINKKLKDMREEDGFTLIELMVVVLIIAILIAIAIPTFLGARTRAQDRAAQSSLRQAVTAAKVLYTDLEDYAAATPAALNLGEPSLEFQVGATSTHLVVSSVEGASPSVKYSAAVRSASGTCWYVRDVVDPTAAVNPGTRWGKSAAAAATCDAADMAGEANATFNAGAGRTPATAPNVT